MSDSFNLKRELQLAIAVAIANGNASPAFAGNFARNLELDINTIDVNPTEVAFAHGPNTFGWRFYPRLQTPDTDGTIRALTQAVLGGPKRDRNENQRQIEPGQRECSAIVVMPNFVPYLQLHSRTSWFRLTNPADRELTVTDSMQLSSAASAVTRITNCTSDPCGCYRPEDVAHLSTVAQQLQERLPYRTETVPIPTENTLGGFELLSGGSGHLSVELVSWYGAPGINPKGETALFLVGEGFSVHETQVIIGGKNCDYELLSRQIMRVIVPEGVQKLGRGDDSRLVDAHVATPFGVSSHLLIPLNEPPASTAASVAWSPTRFDVVLPGRQTKEGAKVANLAFPDHGKIAVKAGSNEVKSTAKMTVSLFTDTPFSLAPAAGSLPEFEIELTGDSSKKLYTVSESGAKVLASQVRSSIETFVAATDDYQPITVKVKGKIEADGVEAFDVPSFLDLRVHIVD